MEDVTKPAPELLLAQVVQGAVLFLLVAHATYEKDYQVPSYLFKLDDNGRPQFKTDGQRSISINEFRASYTVLFLFVVSCAYFFINLLLYITIKLFKGFNLYKTVLILLQDVVFCLFMFIGSIGAVTHPGHRAVQSRETEIIIASGISMFCCVSSGVGVYYSYRIYKGI